LARIDWNAPSASAIVLRVMVPAIMACTAGAAHLPPEAPAVPLVRRGLARARLSPLPRAGPSFSAPRRRVTAAPSIRWAARKRPLRLGLDTVGRWLLLGRPCSCRRGVRTPHS
jgi:hypothetical protein